MPGTASVVRLTGQCGEVGGETIEEVLQRFRVGQAVSATQSRPCRGAREGRHEGEAVVGRGQQRGCRKPRRDQFVPDAQVRQTRGGNDLGEQVMRSGRDRQHGPSRGSIRTDVHGDRAGGCYPGVCQYGAEPVAVDDVGQRR